MAEFNREHRTFKDGHDPTWTAISKSDDDYTSSGKKSLHFYNESYVYTEKGHLVIKTTDEDSSWRGWNPYAKKYQKLTKKFRRLEKNSCN